MTDAPTRAADAEQRDAVRAVFAAVLAEIDQRIKRHEHGEEHTDGPLRLVMSTKGHEAREIRDAIVRIAAAAGVDLESNE